VHKIETLGTLDGPGLRTVVFLQGCTMRCAYCHNADTWDPTKGEAYEVDAIFKIIMRYKPYYQQKGGVTFSGGEPLLQALALSELITKLKKEKIHITLDTAGHIFEQPQKTILSQVDLVLLDIKAVHEADFKSLTGVSGENTFLTLSYLKELGIPYWIRQVILKGINDTTAHMDLLKQLTQGESRERIELLPYHTLGLEKWHEEQLLFKDHLLCKGEFQPPDTHTLMLLRQHLESI